MYATAGNKIPRATTSRAEDRAPFPWEWLGARGYQTRARASHPTVTIAVMTQNKHRFIRCSL